MTTRVLSAMALSVLIAAGTTTGCGNHGHSIPRSGPPSSGYPTLESVAARYSMPDRDMVAVDKVRVFRLTWSRYLIDAQGTPVAPGGLYASPDSLRAAGAQVPHSRDVVYLAAQHGVWIPPGTHGVTYKWRLVTVTAASGAELHVTGAMSDHAPPFLSRFKDARCLERTA